MQSLYTFFTTIDARIEISRVRVDDVITALYVWSISPQLISCQLVDKSQNKIINNHIARFISFHHPIPFKGLVNTWTCPIATINLYITKTSLLIS